MSEEYYAPGGGLLRIERELTADEYKGVVDYLKEKNLVAQDINVNGGIITVKIDGNGSK